MKVAVGLHQNEDDDSDDDAADQPEPGSGITAIGALAQELDVPVVSIVRLQDVIDYLDSQGTHSEALQAILNYRTTYCVY